MCSPAFFKALFSIIMFNILALYPSLQEPQSKMNFPSSTVELNFSRARREDSNVVRYILHSPKCGKLHQVDESAFMALIIIHESGRFQCLGTILDEYHVLSAKDCYNETDVSSLMVIAGYASPYFGRYSQVKYVDRVNKHPKENLAVFVLSKPFTLTKTVQPVNIVGPQWMEQPFTEVYDRFKPYLIAGFQFPSKVFPQRGNLIPKNLTYNFEDEGEIIPPEDKGIGKGKINCVERFGKSGIEMPQIDKSRNFCTRGKTEFCWSALGSPTIIILERKPIQVAIVTHAKCRHLMDSPKPNATEKEKELEYSPIVHLRLDWFYKWISANSLLEKKIAIGYP